MKTKKTLLEEYANHKFPNVKQFETFLRGLPTQGFHDSLDYIGIAGVLYTMDNYDMNGQQITYYNKRTGLGFTVNTEDRYKFGFTDAEVEEPYYIGCWRSDLVYAD